MLARYLGPKLKDRNYQSAIIFRSDTGVDEISPNNGAYKSIMTGIDGFGRILAYELKGSVDVIVARGEP